MRSVKVMCVMAILLTAGLATANTVWNPAANPDPNAIVDGTANWNVAANWTNGVPGVTDQKPVFNGPSSAVECQVTTNTLPFTSNLVLGDGSDFNGILRVMNGGTITKTGSGWTGLGYNADGGTMIVEEGGTVILGDHLWFGVIAGGIGRLVMDGGYVKVANAMDFGRTDTSYGFVTINSGILRARYLPDNNDTPGSLCDIRWGALVLDNNYATPPSPLWSRIDAGTIVGFGGDGELVVTREPFDGATRTFVRAIHPMDPFPAYKETVPEGLVDLAWTNMEPNMLGDPVFVDVWFGTDPTWIVDEIDPNNSGYADFTKIVVASENTTTVQVNAPVVGTPPTTYYWRVDSYIYGADHVNEQDVIVGDVFQFNVTNDFAPTVVIETPDTVTWIDEPVQLDATVSDTGDSTLSIEWTASDSNVTFSPNNTVEDPVVTAAVGTPDEVTLTCTVWDSLNPETNADTMVLYVAADACQGAILAGANYPMDIAEPFCVVDIYDLAALAADWLTDYTLTVPMVIP